MMIIPALFHRDCFYQHALLLRAFTMLTMLSSPTCFFIPDMFQERLAFIRECNAFNGNSAIIIHPITPDDYFYIENNISVSEDETADIIRAFNRSHWNTIIGHMNDGVPIIIRFHVDIMH